MFNIRQAEDKTLICCSSSVERGGGVGEEIASAQTDTCFCTVDRYQKLWKSYVKLRHLLANSPKVKQIDKQKLMQREVSGRSQHHSSAANMEPNMFFHDHGPTFITNGSCQSSVGLFLQLETRFFISILIKHNVDVAAACESQSTAWDGE